MDIKCVLEELDYLSVLKQTDAIEPFLLGKAEESLLKSKQYQMILHESVFEDGGC